MRIIAFITDSSNVRDILAHRGEPTTPSRIAPAWSALWAAADAECVDPGRQWQPSAQTKPAYDSISVLPGS